MYVLNNRMADAMDDEHEEDIGDEETTIVDQKETAKPTKSKGRGHTGPPFVLKKWNAVAMWQWDVECDTCAICRVQVMGK